MIPPGVFLDPLLPSKQAQIASYWKMRGQWSGMISGSRDLATRLAALKGAKDYSAEYALMVGEDHPTAALVSVGRELRLAFGGARYKFEN